MYSHVLDCTLYIMTVGVARSAICFDVFHFVGAAVVPARDFAVPAPEGILDDDNRPSWAFEAASYFCQSSLMKLSKTWLPCGCSQFLRSYVRPFGLLDYGSATLRIKI